MQDRGGVFELPVFADHCCLAVTFRLFRCDPQRVHAFLTEQSAKFFSRLAEEKIKRVGGCCVLTA